MSIASSAVGSFVGASTPTLLNYVAPPLPAGDYLDRLARAQIQLAQPPSELGWGGKIGFALAGAGSAGVLLYALTKQKKKVIYRGQKK